MQVTPFMEGLESQGFLAENNRAVQEVFHEIRMIEICQMENVIT